MNDLLPWKAQHKVCPKCENLYWHGYGGAYIKFVIMQDLSQCVRIECNTCGYWYFVRPADYEQETKDD